MKYLLCFLLAMAPISEIRGAIPYAVSQGIPTPWDFLVPLAGNLLIVPLMLLIMDPIFSWMKRQAGLEKIKEFIYRYEERAMKKMRGYEQIVLVGLFFFVAIPLPTTGAYTGVLAALLLRVPKMRAMAAISLGVVTAGIITWLISHGFRILL